ncbi:hypothetical protein CDAR_620741 [Caerostris darwini]|uniref:Ribosomal protein S13 n=1 Tax=Caerostris darwini TaxID=1538125 RepID=A0AAV4URV7_9ARAC|nr:hypothetical protein CDAR_620741 [Caerostris darwini]
MSFNEPHIKKLLSLTTIESKSLTTARKIRTIQKQIIARLEKCPCTLSNKGGGWWITAKERLRTLEKIKHRLTKNPLSLSLRKAGHYARNKRGKGQGVAEIRPTTRPNGMVCEGVRIRNEVPDGGPHEGRLSSRSLLIPGPKCHLRRAASVSRDPVFPRGPLPETLDPGGIKRDAL